MPSPHGKPPFLQGLGGFRALATLAVLIGHGVAWLTPLPDTPAFYEPVARFTQCGLSGFFILSGFVLQYNHGGRLLLRPLSLVRFALARLARIYPVYLLLLLAAMAGVLQLFSKPWEIPGFRLSGLVALTLTQSWFFLPEAPGIYPLAWAVSTEVFFYLLFPWLSRAISVLSSRRAVLGAALLALGVAGCLDAYVAMRWPWIFAASLASHPSMAEMPEMLAGQLFEWLTYINPCFRIFEFIIGMAMARLFVLGVRLPRGLALAATALLVFLFALPVSKDHFFFSILKNNILFTPSLAILSLSLAAAPPFFASNALLRRIGAASLSIYLVQPWALRPWKGLATLAPGLWSMALPAGIVTTIIAGMLLARFVETPAARVILKK